MAAAPLPPAHNLRLLSIDGGGIKGYTALLILRRIFRSLAAEGNLADMPRPCEVFDLIAGTSTGGLIAVMLGRLHMTIDECITAYETVGKAVFGGGIPVGGQVGKLFRGMTNFAFYDIEKLQEEIRKVMGTKGLSKEEAFLEEQPRCKVSLHPTEENYDCYTWEAASATAAAPLYFRRVKFEKSGEKWSDGGMRRNNPIHEMLNEVSREKDLNEREKGCIISLGTGVPQMKEVSANLAAFLRRSVEIMTDSEDTAAQFAASPEGRELAQSKRYFRFSVPYGMSEIQMEDYKEREKMAALTTEYLRSVGSGDMVESCAKSLLHPDTPRQTAAQPKPCLLPLNTCTHFVERRKYADKLHAFFTPRLQGQQIFVLWGLGGIGKTQIALKFAHAVKDRFAVFWLRAGSFMSFAADYAAIPPLLDDSQKSDDSMNDSDSSNHLRKVLKLLEQSAQDWLLVLDNADDLDDFRDGSNRGTCLAELLPRNGRLLITTRDQRFVGTVAKAQNALRVLPMDDEEAMDLLLSSITTDLIQRKEPKSQTAASELLEELGNLPLAIAQAAANINDRRSTLSDYVELYCEKKKRMGLMKEPIWDFQDPQNNTQSIYITWEVSFEYLEERFPLSARCLSYLGCFHNRDIPQFLLMKLPDFQDMELDEFQEVMKHLLRLALVDQCEGYSGLTEYNVHPLVHERTSTRLSADIGKKYLTTCSNTLAAYYPFLVDVAESSLDTLLARYLLVHALCQVGLAEDLSLVTKQIARLTQCTASYLTAAGMMNFAVLLATRASSMVPLVWQPESPSILSVTKTLCYALNGAAMYTQAEVQCRTALDLIGKMEGQLSEEEMNISQAAFEDQLGVSLAALDKFEDLVAVRRSQLQNRTVHQNPRKEATTKHNLAYALWRAGQIEAAKQLNDELLQQSDTREDIEAIDASARLAMMELRLLISSAQQSSQARSSQNDAQEETLRAREHIYHESRKVNGLHNIDIWKAVTLLTSEYVTAAKIDDAIKVVHEHLAACLPLAFKIEGSFAETFSYIYTNCVVIIYFLKDCERAEDAKSLEDLLTTFINRFEIDLSYAPWDQQADIVNTLGVSLQKLGYFARAESWHRESLKMSQAQSSSLTADTHVASGSVGLNDVVYYNIMLAIARQGRVTESRSFREENEDTISRAEAIYGSLDESIQQDEAEKCIYDKAMLGLRSGTIKHGDQWWEEKQAAIGTAELRYGRLKARAEGADIQLAKSNVRAGPSRLSRWLGHLPTRERGTKQP